MGAGTAPMIFWHGLITYSLDWFRKREECLSNLALGGTSTVDRVASSLTEALPVVRDKSVACKRLRACPGAMAGWLRCSLNASRATGLQFPSRGNQSRDRATIDKKVPKGEGTGRERSGVPAPPLLITALAET